MNLTWTLACGESRKEDVNMGGTQPASGEQKQMAVKDNRGEIRTQGDSGHKRMENLRSREASPSQHSSLSGPSLSQDPWLRTLVQFALIWPSMALSFRQHRHPTAPRSVPHSPPGTAPQYYNMGRNLEGFGRRPNREVPRKARYQGSVGPGKGD